MTGKSTKSKTLNELRSEFLQLREQIAEAQADRPPEPVKDYVFAGIDGPVRLSELFAQKSELFVIHNMGTNCAYCTLWADGFNGVLQHLSNRAAVVVSSPDAVEVLQQFRADRHWQLDMVSTSDNQFARDMGYQNDRGYHPGVSVFSNAKNQLTRVADTPFGPGDDYCAVWHLFDLLPDGANAWQPKFSY